MTTMSNRPQRHILAAALLVAACVHPLPASAAAGDIAGEYYSTDIVTTLNGMEISSINIGGQTLISVENMKDYGFDVNWLSDVKRLEVFNSHSEIDGAPPPVERSDLPAGSVLGHYYETDIVTMLDGEEITAYHLGGKTYLLAEQMTEFGYKVDWNAEAKTLSVISPELAGYCYSIPLTASGGNIEEEGRGAFAVLFENGKRTGSGDTNYFKSGLDFDGKEYAISMSFYQNEGLFQSQYLLEKLRALVSSGYGVATEIDMDPAEKYSEVNKSVTIMINGQRAEKIAVSMGAGNGHRDFTFTFRDIAPYTLDEIQSVYFAVNGGPMTEIVLPDYIQE